MRYRADLDGLRAVAVLLVIAHHANWPLPNEAGLGGVTAFFVLSGFLITSLLEEERRTTGRVDLTAFYVRRFARLAPAFAVLLVFVAIAGVLGAWGAAPWPRDVAAAALYLGNWLPSFGVLLGPVGHSWSLAIEEQFYLLWPAALLLVPRRWLPFGIAALIVAAVLQRYLLAWPWDLYSTPARVDGLLVGCAIALWGRRLPRVTGEIALVLLVALSIITNTETVDIATVCGAVIILARPRVLEPLAPLGRRAYSLYLWNWPLSLIAGPATVPLTLIAGELSYRLVERPARDAGRRWLARRSPDPAEVIELHAAVQG